MLGLGFTCLMACGGCFLVVVIGYCGWVCVYLSGMVLLFIRFGLRCVNSVVAVATFGFRMVFNGFLFGFI